MENIDGEQKGPEGNRSYGPPAQSSHNLFDVRTRTFIQDHSPLIMSTLALIISFASLLVTYRIWFFQNAANDHRLTFDGANLEQDGADPNIWTAYVHVKNASYNCVTILGISLRLNMIVRDYSTLENACNTELAKRVFTDRYKNDEIGRNERAGITTKVGLPESCRGNVDGPFFGLAVLNGIDQSGKEFTQIIRIDTAKVNFTGKRKAPPN
jgi:hypothetical protein